MSQFLFLHPPRVELCVFRVVFDMAQRVEEGAPFFGLYFLREAADARARDRVDEFSLGKRGLHQLGHFVGQCVERPAEVDGVVRVVVDVEVLPADLPRFLY